MNETDDLELPREWKVINLAELGHITDGDWILREHYAEDGVRLLQVGDVGSGRFIGKSDRFIGKKTATELKCTFLKPGQILISRMPDPIGRACILPKLPYQAITAVDVTILTPNPKVVETGYAVMALNSDLHIRQCTRMATGVTRQRISRSNLGRVRLPLPPLPEQKKIAHILSTVQRAIEAQERIIQTTTELKKSLMHKLFTEGLRNEPQKQTEIGPIPESWETPTVESVCTIKASAMSYKQLEDASNVPNGLRVIGIKVSDMNLPGNEIEVHFSNLERLLPEKEALKRTVPKNSIVFPKRGAAIATNKKRLTTCHTVLDPNLIAVMPTKAVNHRYLYHWFNTFDLKKITDPGPTPQLNKKDIAPLKFPMPPIEEQESIAAAIDAAEEKTTLHGRKRVQLQDLFHTLLHELMTAKTRVDGVDL
jgi:type I restriction enzyme S subunit